MRKRSDMFQNSAEGNTHDPCSQPYEVLGSHAAVLTICFLTMLLGSVAVYYCAIAAHNASESAAPI